MQRALVLNAGSSTFKWSVLATEDERVLASGNERWSSESSSVRRQQIRSVVEATPSWDAVGHRVVHGGSRFRNATRIDSAVERELARLVPFAPGHMPAALLGINAISEAFPQLPQVAAFDTAFHQSLPEAAASYPLPFEWTNQWELKRFGFHGLSVEYAVHRAAQLLGRTPARLVVCHLGSGCSVTAVAAGRSVDTSMGFTPLEGLMMATRSGSVDPGLLLHLQQHCQVGASELREALEKRSGLLGVSGVSKDLREVMVASQSGSSRAALAVDQFVLSVRRTVGAMMAVLGGLDGLIFTGGIGENSSDIRRQVAASLSFAGLVLDDAANEANQADSILSSPEATAACLVIAAREDLAIVRQMVRVLDRSG